jgi:hypothetical protein
MPNTTLPHDLVQAQQALTRTYAALAAPRPGNYTALRHRMLQLSQQVFWHPYWSTTSGRSTGLAELRQQARTEQTEARS